MIDPVTIIFFLAVAFIVSFPLLVSEKTLGRVLSLQGLDKEWDKRFPEVEDQEVFAFWDAVVGSFQNGRKRRPVSKPSVRIQDVYRSLFKEESSMDAKELQAFTLTMKEKFGVDLSDVNEPWELELGDLFAKAQAAAAGRG